MMNESYTNKKLNVLLMVSWYGPRGEKPTGGIFHYEQAIELNKYCNCAIYCPYDRMISNSVECHDDWGILTYRSKYQLEKKIRNRWYMFLAMKKIVREFAPDIIHGNVATEAGRFAVILGNIFHIPVILTEHSAAEYSGVYTFPHHMYAKYAYKHSKYNLCVSDHLTEALSALFPQYKFHTLYNGIIPPCEDGFEHGFRINGVVNFAMVAGLYDEKIKGMQYVIPALKKLEANGVQFIFHMIGGGEYLQFYKDMAMKMGVYNNIIFYDRCEKAKVYSIVNEMDFVISASIVESFGCSLAEAAMLGKPLVATKCGGPESIVNDDNGILVKKNDLDALVDGIMQMVNSYNEYDSEVIKSNAIKKFAIENITNEYLDIYHRVILGEV